MRKCTGKRERLDDFVNVESATTTPDGGGAPSRTWATFANNLPCKVHRVGGGESLRGGQVDATATHSVKTRYRTDITPAMRLNWSGRILNVVRLRDDMKQPDQFMYIDCKEAV